MSCLYDLQEGEESFNIQKECTKKFLIDLHSSLPLGDRFELEPFYSSMVTTFAKYFRIQYMGLKEGLKDL